MGGQIRLALVGDTMLGRGVAAALDRLPPDQLVDEVVAAEIRSADLAILNLECCLSTRGSRWPDPAKPFFFRGPPSAIGLLTYLGVNAVTLANNHALDYGIEALTDTLALLDQAGIQHVGAGPDRDAARRPCVLEAKGFRVGLVAFTDHPREYAASERQPGVAYADLAHGIPTWVLEAVATTAADAVVVTPHWGPNMSDRPVERVRRFIVARAPFDIDNGMLTPSLKIRRHKIKAVYGDALEALYEKPAAQPAEPGSAEARAPAQP